MTPLRQKFIEDMQLRGLGRKTQIAYANAVRDLAAYFGKSPDEIVEAELRTYFLYLDTRPHERGSSANKVQMRCGGGLSLQSPDAR